MSLEDLAINSHLVEAIRQAENGNPDRLLIIATKAATPEAQKLIAEFRTQVKREKQISIERYAALIEAVQGHFER